MLCDRQRICIGVFDVSDLLFITHYHHKNKDAKPVTPLHTDKFHLLALC